MFAKLITIEACHGVNSATHQANFDWLSKSGNRMISLSVYGNPATTQYAAVWLKRSGPAWVATHGLNGDQYQAFFDKWTGKGYVPVLLSATGAAANAIFAAVFEQGVQGGWFSHHRMDAGSEDNSGTFDNANKTAHNAQMILKSFGIYGTNSDRRYVGIWHANPGFTKWHVYPSDTATSYQTNFNAETKIPNYRPVSVALSDDGIYCSLFKDDMVGQWAARHGMTADAYQQEFNMQKKAGLYLISVQGGGNGSSTRYAAIFAKQDIPMVKKWTVKGSARPGLTDFDEIMRKFMQSQAVRSAQLTIYKNGAVKISRAYTWAKAGYKIVKTSDKFLLASCSKMFLEAAIQSLYDAKILKPGDKV